MKKDSKIYIAGHKGLVGSALWNNLISKGYTNLVGRTIEELDLMNQQAVAEYFQTEKPEYVILAAAKVGGIIANNTYRGQFIYENLQIQNNVIHQAYVNEVKRLLFLGSTCIYPRDAQQPMLENCLLNGELEYTNEPYAIAKIAGLKMCESYNLQYGTNFIAVMPTNLYGPNDNFDLEKSHVLPAIIRKIHLGKCLEENNWDAIKEDLNKRPIEGVCGKNTEEEIRIILSKYGIKNNPQIDTDKQIKITVEIWGTGAPLREFLWSEDMADACIFIMENVSFNDLVSIHQQSSADKLSVPISGKNFRDHQWTNEIRNTHINIGTGKELSIKALVNLIKATIGFKGDLYFNKEKPDGSMRKLTDPSKLHALGWHHKIDIDEGISKLYDWYIKN